MKRLAASAFALLAAALGALRDAVSMGAARAIPVLENERVVEQLGFGMLVIEPVARMFDACVRANFDQAIALGGS